MTNWYYNIKWWFKNLWTFRKALWQYRSWDYSYIYEFEKVHLQELHKAITNEKYFVSVNAHKQQKRIQVLLNLLERIQNDPYLDMYYEFNDAKWEDLNDGTHLLIDSGVVNKPLVNHKAVDHYKQEQADKEYYYKLLARYSAGLWT